MMSKARDSGRSIVTVGFAARQAGSGIAYGSVRGLGEAVTLRTPFSLTIRKALEGRDVAYAAITSIVAEATRRGFRNVEIRFADSRLVDDLAERRVVPQALVVPYVALRCALNRFGTVRIVASDDRTVRDLTARALADASFERAA